MPQGEAEKPIIPLPDPTPENLRDFMRWYVQEVVRVTVTEPLIKMIREGKIKL